MSFSTFSKDFAESAFTNVENQFITKYLPEANGDAVRVYLYGLYLCGRPQEFDAKSAAKLLHLSLEKVVEIFSFWEECGLVQILSKDPLFVEYLPVAANLGKPKPLRPEKYTQFNRELFKLLQRAKTDFKPYELQRILEFLENNPMEQQAFLLVVEYCAKKDGEKLTANHVINKAQKLVREHKFTYEQVEADLADYNVHEREISKIFTLLGIYRKPQEQDYDLLSKWTGSGIEPSALYLAAGSLKSKSMSVLDELVGELIEKNARTEAEAKEYLARREEIFKTVFKVARRLGVKVANPRAYAKEYVERWLDNGYDAESLDLVAAVSMKLSYGFQEMDVMLSEMYKEGIVDEDGVKEYCAARNSELKLLQAIQQECGVIRKTHAALAMAAAWRSWNFSDEMILEAAKRSANAASPLAYINKLLSEWKRAAVFSPSEIPAATKNPPAIRSEAAIAADERSDRERFYAERRQRALKNVETARAIAAKDEGYTAADIAVRKGEIALAKAEIFSPETAEALRRELEAHKKERAAALERLNLTERDFVPRYFCRECSDTGYLPDGRPCGCYKK